MFEAIFGSQSRERVFVYINSRGQGYAREIARFFNTSVTPIQKQLETLERENVLYAEYEGKTLLYKLNPRYALYKELKALLDKAISYYPPAEQEALLKDRRRPRRKGKPLEL